MGKWGMDLGDRFLATKFQAQVGEPIEHENRGGGGSDRALSPAPDCVSEQGTQAQGGLGKGESRGEARSR